jgi:tripartite-type tricarboxylate transporter receptor subunit TctC
MRLERCNACSRIRIGISGVLDRRVSRAAYGHIFARMPRTANARYRSLSTELSSGTRSERKDRGASDRRRPVGPFVAATLLAGVLFGASHVAAQSFPTKPIRLVIGSAPGSGNDVASRIVMAKASEALGQPVVVENRPGANQRIAPEIVARATPDGYTLLQCGTVTTAINPAMYRVLKYDPLKDFAPITLFARAPNVLLVRNDSPAKTARDFVNHVVAHPDKFNYGSSGVGSTLHLSMEMLSMMVPGFKMTHVPYKGGALALTDLLGGQLTAVFQNITVALPAVRSGRVRALGVAAPARSAYMPDVPTFAESGYALDVSAWYGACAPAAVPKTVLGRLNTAMVDALRLPEIRERFTEMGIEPAPMSVQAFDAFIRNETAKWAKAVKAAGVPLQ